jgi:hypothetical protein
VGELPKACEKCAPFGGLWRETDAGMRRCLCARGNALKASQAAASAIPQHVEPVITATSAKGAVEAMTAIPFFPTEDMARTMIADELRQMCRSRVELFWLVKRMIELYRKWPGVPELRMVYCSKHIPLDGKKALGISESFPEGIPSEKQEALASLALPPGENMREVLQIEAAVRELAPAKTMPAPRPQDRVSIPSGLVTQADIDRAIEVNRERRAARAAAEERER